MKGLRVRIKIVVWPDGNWVAYGDQTTVADRHVDEILSEYPIGGSHYWIEADVPLPTTIQGKVV